MAKKQIKKSTWFYLLAAGGAIITSVMAISIVSAAKEEVKVVTTVHDIPAYTPITEADLQVVSKPKKAVPDDAAKTITEVVGKYTSMSLTEDSILREKNIITGASRLAGVVAKQNNSNLVAISIPTQKTDLGTAVRPGDYINIVGLIKEQNNTLKYIKVDNVPVLSIDTSDKNNNSGPNLWVLVDKNSQSSEVQKSIVGGTVRIELTSKGEGSK